MNAKKLLIGVTLVYAAVAAVAVFHYEAAISALREERDSLKVQVCEQSYLGSKARFDDGPAPLDAVTGSDELARLRNENGEIRGRIEEAGKSLRQLTQDKAALEERLQELLKPTREDIVSSTLRTSMSTNEGLLTGGYQTADGRYQFTSIEPHIDQLPDGRAGIRLRARQYSLPPEAVGQMRLDSLRTGAGNTLQHGELWAAKDLARLAETLGTDGRGDMMTSPAITVLPGQEAQIAIGQYRLSTTPKLSVDGSHVEIELRVEQPRESTEVSEPSSGPNR